MNAYGYNPGLHAGSKRGGGTVRRMMLAVVAVLALSAIVPALASAQVTWATNYIPVTKSTAMEWSGKLKISYAAASSALECTEKAEGVMGADGTGEITKMTMSSCVNVKGCAAPNAIVALNLPWHTELVASGGTLKNVLRSGGKGNPTFKVECTVLVKIVEECTASTLSLPATNGESGVTVSFNDENLSCVEVSPSKGGPVTEKLEGTQTIVAPGQGTLSAQKEEPVWLKEGLPLKEAKLIEWSKDKISLFVPLDGTLGVRCEDSAQGTAEAAGVGTITKFTMTKCENAPSESKCNGAYSLEATHLPWKSELYFGYEGVVSETFTEDGAGVPGIKLKCEWGVKEETTDECKAFIQKLTNNTERGVFAEVSRGLSCSPYAGEVFDETPQKITLVSGETLHVS